MKKIIISSILLSMASCGPIMTGTTESKLIKTVSIDQGCPKENIKVIDKVRSTTGGTYSLDACGKRVIYKLIGNTFIEAPKVNAGK